jgi:hypothetical protein
MLRRQDDVMFKVADAASAMAATAKGGFVPQTVNSAKL